MKNVELEKKVIEGFLKLVDAGYTTKDAVKTLDYYIFIKYNNEFNNLTAREQERVRDIMHSLKLVHI